MSFIKRILGMESGDVKSVIETGADVAKSFSSKEQGTRRQQLDMMTDTPLSKNIRPIVMIWALVLLTVYLVGLSLGMKFPDDVGVIIKWLVSAATIFYFPGRTAEKWMKNKK